MFEKKRRLMKRKSNYRFFVIDVVILSDVLMAILGQINNKNNLNLDKHMRKVSLMLYHFI